MFDKLGGDNTIIKTKGRDSRMEQMLKDYEQYNMITNQKLSDIAKNSQEGDNPIFITLKLK